LGIHSEVRIYADVADENNRIIALALASYAFLGKLLDLSVPVLHF